MIEQMEKEARMQLAETSDTRRALLKVDLACFLSIFIHTND